MMIAAGRRLGDAARLPPSRLHRATPQRRAVLASRVRSAVSVPKPTSSLNHTRPVRIFREKWDRMHK